MVINTHRGIYAYTRLPYDVASAPELFQKVMDLILQGMDKVTCYLVLITRSSKAEHLRHLEEVLHRLRDHGVRLKMDKCRFMQDNVEYLG